jgi:hypothetical protein
MIVHEGFGRPYIGYSISWVNLAIALLFWYIISIVILFLYDKSKKESEDIYRAAINKSPLSAAVFRGLMWGLFAFLATELIAPILAFVPTLSDHLCIWPPAWASITIWLLSYFLVPNIIGGITIVVVMYLLLSRNNNIRPIYKWGGLVCGLCVACAGLLISKVLGSQFCCVKPSYTFTFLLVVWVMVIYEWVVLRLVKD